METVKVKIERIGWHKKYGAVILICMAILLSGCSDKPSTSTAKEAVLAAYNKENAEKYDLTYYAIDFKRSNGQEVNLLGQNLYRVDGVAHIILRKDSLITMEDGKFAKKGQENVGLKISVFFAKTEQGWKVVDIR